MILTCPECATSYFVDDSAVGSGRMVRCASCAASWRAEPPPPLELSTPAPERAAAEPPPPADVDLFEPAPADRPAEELPKVFRARAEIGRRTREAAVQGVIWAGLGAAFALVFGAMVIFRGDVVRVWPKAASAYASVGLAVNPVGLTIEDVHFQRGLQEGHASLVVSGSVRNIRPHTVVSPPLAISLVDKHGKALAARTVSPGDSRMEPGQTRRFTVSFLDPPMAAADIELMFAREEGLPRLRRGSHGAPDLSLQTHGQPKMMVLSTTVSEARPLPSGSPYALRAPNVGTERPGGT
jgi:predicted Zn finger-like uncharacterized protein